MNWVDRINLKLEDVTLIYNRHKINHYEMKFIALMPLL